MRKEIRFEGFESHFQRAQTEEIEEGDSNLNSSKFEKDQDSNLDSRKGQEGLLEEVDLNPCAIDSNLNSSKVCSDGWIRISL